MKPFIVGAYVERCTGFTELPLLPPSFLNVKMEIQYTGMGEAAEKFYILLESSSAKQSLALCALVLVTRPSSLPDQLQYLFLPKERPCKIHFSTHAVPLLGLHWTI